MSDFDLLAIARWIHFAAVFALFGMPLFWILCGEDRQKSGLPQSLRISVLLLRIAVPVACVSGVAWLAGTLANMAGGYASVLDPKTLQLFFLATQFGPLAMLRLGLFLALFVIGVLPLTRRAWFFALLVIAAILLVTQAWFGHAAEGGASLAGAAMIVAYAVHLLAGAAWLGGLPVLLLALIEVRRPANADETQSAARLCWRFSAMAIVAVVLVLLSGIANTLFRVGDAVGSLLLTAYGAVLLVKLLLVAAMLALAYFNRYVAVPQLAEGRRGLLHLRISVGTELALGILVLGAAAVLGILPPPQ
ncbi:MAG TPA: CopD family protein [Methylovirgula sp.]|nr:CopD family protein [Methylovirgula sp.]